MTTPNEPQRAVQRLTYPDLGYDSEGDLMGWLVAKDDLRLLLSERAELLATVERMRGTASGLLDGVAFFETSEGRRSYSFKPSFAAAYQEARAALTTGKATTPNAGERG